MTKLASRILRFCTLLLITCSIAACSTNSSVVDNGIIQKRKYRKGIHLNILKKQKVREHTIPEEVIVEHQAPQVNITEEHVKSQPRPKALLGPIIDQIQTPKSNPLGMVKRIVRQKIPSKNDDSKHSIAPLHEPKAVTETRTITGQYQKGGKKALLLAWIFALMPLLIWVVGTMGFPVLQLVIAFFAFVAFLLALILGLRNRQFSSHARKALWLLFLAIVFWAAVYSVLTFVLAMTLI